MSAFLLFVRFLRSSCEPGSAVMRDDPLPPASACARGSGSRGRRAGVARASGPASPARAPGSGPTGQATKNMTRSAKGTLTEPGTNVKQKTGLNRAILAKGWHQFALALASAARYSGTRVVAVPPQRTSQRCSACGHVDPKSRESQAVFRCTHCNHVEHADVNAAKNILAAGLAVTACGDLQPIGGSMKQEPAGNREELLPQPHTAA